MTGLAQINVVGGMTMAVFRGTGPKVIALPVRNYHRTNGSNPPADPNAVGALWKTPVEIRFSDVLIPACKAGDILDCRFMMEASNKISPPDTVELAGGLFLTQSAVGIEGIPLDGTYVAVNVDAARHHEDYSVTGVATVPHDGDWYVGAMMYGGGGSYSKPGDYLTVEQGPKYNALTVLRFRSG